MRSVLVIRGDVTVGLYFSEEMTDLKYCKRRNFRGRKISYFFVQNLFFLLNDHKQLKEEKTIEWFQSQVEETSVLK